MGTEKKSAIKLKIKPVNNLMEEIVTEMMGEILEDIKVCNCPRCLVDIMAKALNDLPPKYFVSEKGKVFSRVDALKQQTEVDVISAITKAAIIVKRHPRH